MDKKIAVIGAGATGLAAARTLAAGGFRVDVYEKDDYIGGLCVSHKTSGADVEKIYHHIFTSDSHIVGLAGELGLALSWKAPRDAFYAGGKIFPFTSPVDLLKFSHLPFIYRVTMGMLVLRAGLEKKIPEGVTAREWISAKAGRPVYEKVWKPLMESKFDADADDISAAWIWGKFKLRGSTRADKVGREMFGYMDGGFMLLLEALAKEIESYGGKVISSAEVKKLVKSIGGWEVCGNEYDCVLFTGPPASFANFADGFAGRDYEAKCLGVSYKANLCALLETRAPLSKYYWTTVADKTVPFVAVIEHTNMVDKKFYGGSNLVYLTRYLDASDPLYAAPDDEVRRLFVDGLKKIYPSFTEADCVSFTLTRSRYAQPVVRLGYRETIPEVRTPARGLYLSSMAQIYPEDRGMNYAVREGFRAAEIIKSDFIA